MEPTLDEHKGTGPDPQVCGECGLTTGPGNKFQPAYEDWLVTDEDKWMCESCRRTYSPPSWRKVLLAICVSIAVVIGTLDILRWIYRMANAYLW